MNLLINDLSLHGQFRDILEFHNALSRIMSIRLMAQKYGWELHCHRNIANRQVTASIIVLQAIQSLPREEKQSVMQWLTRQGPFWDDNRTHSSDDLMEVEADGEVVTDTAVGEAAYCCQNGIDQRLVSLTPSNWEREIIPVLFRLDDKRSRRAEVKNYWVESVLENTFQTEQPPIKSWVQLETVARARTNNLTLSQEAFQPLSGHPFVASAAQRILGLLNILNKLKGCFDKNGQRTPEGQDIYQCFFTGKKGGGGAGAIFKDSSDAEKNLYRREMTFPHPDDPATTLFCPMHGRVQTPQFRIHFSWPFTATESAYVVYIGPKITTR